jgi:hypothetical protein
MTAASFSVELSPEMQRLVFLRQGLQELLVQTKPQFIGNPGSPDSEILIGLTRAVHGGVPLPETDQLLRTIDTPVGGSDLAALDTFKNSLCIVLRLASKFHDSSLAKTGPNSMAVLTLLEQPDNVPDLTLLRYAEIFTLGTDTQMKSWAWAREVAANSIANDQRLPRAPTYYSS